VIVEGAIVDREGARRGYVRLQNGFVVETGGIGTDSTRGKKRRIRGIVVPSPVNAHTHLGDSVWQREPPHLPVEQIVGSPSGLKFRLLSETPGPVKVRAMRDALRQMVRGGVGATIDFREEGRAGADLLRAAANGLPIAVHILGRPLRRPIDRSEVDSVLRVTDGIGLSSIAQDPRSVRETIARRCRALGKRYALHASETVRESVREYLHPRPDLLVHLSEATDADLADVASAKVAVAICPRSNALFGRRPDIARFVSAGVAVLLGTDNAMFQAPSIWRELEFAYHSARLVRRPVRPEFLFHAAFVAPWEWLGKPDSSRIAAGSPAGPIILRLPTDDPYYQVVVRATEHLIVRPEPRRP
jgi:cytosine/adenosine deaminase-related metal-dependent hydrolase